MKKQYYILLLILPFLLLSGCTAETSSQNHAYSKQLKSRIVASSSPKINTSSVNEIILVPVNKNKSTRQTPINSPNSTYTNVDGEAVSKPYKAPSIPIGASAQCRDGTYSFSTHHRGTCSHHGGVARWLY